MSMDANGKTDTSEFFVQMFVVKNFLESCDVVEGE